MTNRTELAARYAHEMPMSAREVLRHVCRGIVAMPEFQLGSGTRARIGGYLPPESDADGRLLSGFDVFFENGLHVEFMIVNTGWSRLNGTSPHWVPRREEVAS